MANRRRPPERSSIRSSTRGGNSILKLTSTTTGHDILIRAKDESGDDQPRTQQPEPIPHLLSEGACLAWTLGEGVIAGFAEGSAAFGQFEVTVPMLIIDGVSAGAHYVGCGNFFDLGIGPF